MAQILNTLQELVVSICDQLYAERSLITKGSVKKLVLMHGLWTDDELEQEIPIYIKEWRLHNLEESPESHELARYKTELAKAQETIQKLNAELTTLRLDLIKSLRGMLNGQPSRF